MQPGDDVGTLTVTGNYTQSAGGNLLIAVTPTAISSLSIAGTASLAGTVTFAYAPGTYAARSYAFLTAAGGLGGTSFTTVAGTAPSGFAQSVTYTTTSASLALAVPVAPVPVAPLRLPPFRLSRRGRDRRRQARRTDRRFARRPIVVQRPGDGDGNGGAAGDRYVAWWRHHAGMRWSGGSRAGKLRSGDATPFCRCGGWLQFSDSPMQVDGAGTSPGFNANTVRLLAGFDRPVFDERCRVGVAAGFDQTWLRDGNGGTGNSQVARFAVYGSALLSPFVASAALSYGHDWNTTQRVTGVGSAPESRGGDEISGGMQLSLPIAAGGFTLTPMGGVRFATINEGGFTETGSGTLGAFVVSGNGNGFTDVVPYARIKAERVFVTDAALTIAVSGQVGYDYQAGTVTPSVLVTSLDGTTFNTAGTRLDRGSAVVGAGVSTGRGNWSVFANYRANIAGNWYSQTALAGFRMMF